MKETKDLPFVYLDVFMDEQNVPMKNFNRIYKKLREHSPNALDKTLNRIVKEVLSVTNL